MRHVNAIAALAVLSPALAAASVLGPTKDTARASYQAPYADVTSTRRPRPEWAALGPNWGSPANKPWLSRAGIDAAKQAYGRGPSWRDPAMKPVLWRAPR